MVSGTVCSTPLDTNKTSNKTWNDRAMHQS